MCRLLVLAGLLVLTGSGLTSNIDQSRDKNVKNEEDKEELVLLEVDIKEPEKRSPISATGIYGASANPQLIIRQGEEAHEVQLPPEYLALIQQYVAGQRHRQNIHAQNPQIRQQQPQPPSQQQIQVQPQQIVALNPQQPELEIEQYHIETSQAQRRPPPVQPALFYAPEHRHVQQPEVVVIPSPSPPPPPPPPPPPSPAPRPRIHPVAQQQFHYHQVIPVQHYGYEDQGRVSEHEAIDIAKAQANAEAQALAFQKVAQAAHIKHQESALEQIRQAEEKYRQESALEQIKQGESLSEAERAQRVYPKDPEEAYKARLKQQATALIAEQRRAKEAAEYKAHSDAILKLQATQEAHVRQQEEAHRNALNFEKNQIRAQAEAQAIANAQALALYRAHQEARLKAQKEAQSAAKSQQESQKIDPEHTPVVQYLLPNSVPLPSPEVYLPKAQQIYREAQEQQLREMQQQQQQQQPIRVQPQQHVPRKQVSLVVEQPIEQARPGPHFVRVHAKPQQAQHQPQILTREDLAILLNSGYVLATDGGQVYLTKKHRSEAYARAPQPEYIAYQESGPIARP